MARKKVVIKKTEQAPTMGVVRALAQRVKVQAVAKDYDISNVSKVYVSRNRFVGPVLTKLASMFKGSVVGNSVIVGKRTIQVVADDSVFKDLPLADSRGIVVKTVSNENLMLIVDISKFLK